MEHPKLLLAQAQELKEELVATRRHLHQHPELSDMEFETALFIERKLDEYDIPHRRIGDTGIVGIIRGVKGDGDTIALRADIDACGHDAHTACLLAAARILQNSRDLFRGEVRLFFQPAEETGGAPKRFVENGAIEGVSSIFGLHCAPDLPVGVIGLKPGLNNAAVDRFRIEILGKSSHASTPHLGVDALYIASQTTVALQAIVTRLSSPIEPLLIGVGKMSSGTIYNAVAADAFLEGTTRTINQKARLFIRQEIEKIACECAASFGGIAKVAFTEVTSALINDPAINAMATRTAVSLFGKDRVISNRALSLNGDDYAEFMAPTGLKGCYAYLGTGNPGLPTTQHSVHSCDFDIDEEALIFGAALYAGYALDALN